MNSILAFLRQPTSIAGLSTIVGTVMGLLSGSTSWQTAVPLLVGSVVAIAIPENPAAKTSIQAATANIIAAEQAIVTKTPVADKLG